MKVELHCHTSRYSGCATAGPRDIVAALADAGYDAVYITEHDAVWSDRELEKLRRKMPGLLVFPGIERTLQAPGGVHLLILGTNDEAYLRTEDAREIVDRARRRKHLTILAHPHRWPGGDGILWAGIYPDALEARSFNQNAEAGERTEAVGENLGLPRVYAGDTHALHFVDRFWIETARPLVEAGDIYSIVRERAYENRTA